MEKGPLKQTMSVQHLPRNQRRTQLQQTPLYHRRTALSRHQRTIKALKNLCYVRPRERVEMQPARKRKVVSRPRLPTPSFLGRSSRRDGRDGRRCRRWGHCVERRAAVRDRGRRTRDDHPFPVSERDLRTFVMPILVGLGTRAFGGRLDDFRTCSRER